MTTEVLFRDTVVGVRHCQGAAWHCQGAAKALPITTFIIILLLLF